MKIPKSNRINTVLSNNFSTYNEKEKSGYKWKTLHEILYPVLILSQCFGLIPVYGITARTPYKLEFRLISLKTFHTFIVISGVIFLGLGNGQQFVDDGIDFSNARKFV